jgi:hypothetical protein
MIHRSTADESPSSILIIYYHHHHTIIDHELSKVHGLLKGKVIKLRTYCWLSMKTSCISRRTVLARGKKDSKGYSISLV